MATCCRCQTGAEHSLNGLNFCRQHYREFLQGKLYKHIKSLGLDPRKSYYISASPFNEIMIQALFRYFKHNLDFFHNLRFHHSCENFEPLYERMYGKQAIQVYVEENSENMIEIIATPGYLLAINILLSVSKGDIVTLVNMFYTPSKVFVLEDLSLYDCYLFGAEYDSSHFGPALLESSLDFRPVLGCLRRIHCSI